jgi:hypothetical protein
MPAICRVFIQQRLSGQSEEIPFRGPVWSEVQNSAILGLDWREAGVQSGYYRGCRTAGTVGMRESEGYTDSSEELCGYLSTGFDLCGG